VNLEPADGEEAMARMRAAGAELTAVGGAEDSPAAGEGRRP
jgi:hypothetical protein